MDVDARPDFSSVQIDDCEGARLLTRHLLGLGHRRFAILSVMRRAGEAPIFRTAGETGQQLVAGLASDQDRPPAFDSEVEEERLLEEIPGDDSEEEIVAARAVPAAAVVVGL